MNEVLHANIFFIIASIATVIFCILLSLILFHVFKMVRSLRRIIERIEAGSEVIAQDVAHVRDMVASGGMFARLIQFFMGGRGHSRRSRGRRADD